MQAPHLHLFAMHRWIPVILLSLFIQVTQAAPQPWPERVSFPADIMVEIVQEGPGIGANIYQTNHFELISDLPLAKSALCQALEVMEATLASLQALPLGFEIPKTDNRYVVRLVTHEDDFLNEGGIHGAGGIYIPESRQTLIRINSLQPEYSTDGRIALIRKRGMIAHEVTHQLQHDLLHTLPTWLIEGLAMYLESVPFRSGAFEFENANFATAEGLRRCTTKHYQIIPLEELMTMDRTQWNHKFTTTPNDNHRTYLSAYLLTYYFLHLAPTKDGAALRTFIQASQQATSPRQRRQALEQLIQGSNFIKLQHTLSRCYAEKGFSITPLQRPTYAAVE